MSKARIGLIYDHTHVEAVGHYCLRALLDLTVVDHIHPATLEDVAPDRCDLYLYIDDGWNYAWHDALRPCAYWAIETPISFERCLNRAGRADWVFCAQRNGAQALRQAGVPNVEWLPLACDPLIHRPHQTQKVWDTCFIGRVYGPERKSLVDILTRTFPNTFVGRAYFEEAARFYSSSRTAFNRSAAGDLNLRTFECLGCATLLITDALDDNGLNEMFQDGVHLATYRSPDELLDKTRYYLTNEEVRERVARSGRQEVLARHTFSHRMQRILEVTQPPTALRGSTTTFQDNATSPQSPSQFQTPKTQDSAAELTIADPVASAETDQPVLSLCMIVRNAKNTLRPCLESIRPWVDEMVVIDTGSIDDTCEIAQGLGAQLYHFPWCDDFSAARNESLRHARGRWLFWMDADDTISPENGRGLRELAEKTNDDQLWAYVMQVHCPGRPNDGPDSVTVVDHVKLLRNRADVRFEGRIHEQVLSSIRRGGGRVGWSDLFVLHSGSDLTSEGQATKIERDLRILLLELVERPDHPFTLFNLGMTFSELRAVDMAARFLRKSLAIADPQESHVRKAYALLAHCCAQSGQLILAWDALRDGLKHYPNDVELRFREGLLHQMTGELEEAERAYWQVLTSKEDRHFSSIDRGIAGYKARQNLAQVYKERAEFAKAELQWRQIARDYPHYRLAWQGLSEVLILQGKIREGRLLTARLTEDPAMRLLGYILHGKFAEAAGDIGEARRVWEHAAQVSKDDLEPLRCLCQLVFNTGDAEEAKGLLQSLVQRDPMDAAARHNLGLTYLRLNSSKQAIEALRESLRLRPKSAATVLYLGQALEQSGNHSEARAAWQRVVRMDPDSIAGHEARERLARVSKVSMPAA